MDLFERELGIANKYIVDMTFIFILLTVFVQSIFFIGDYILFINRNNKLIGGILMSLSPIILSAVLLLIKCPAVIAKNIFLINSFGWFIGAILVGLLIINKNRSKIQSLQLVKKEYKFTIRLIGIKIIAWAQIIGVILYWVLFLKLMPDLFKMPWIFILIPCSFLVLLAGTGILLQKNWARLLAILLYVLKIFEIIFKAVSKIYLHRLLNTIDIFGYSLVLIICVSIIWFLSRGFIKEEK